MNKFPSLEELKVTPHLFQLETCPEEVGMIFPDGKFYWLRESDTEWTESMFNTEFWLSFYSNLLFFGFID